MRETRRRPLTYVWKAGQKRRTPPLSRLHPGEAEAMLEAEYALRRAEEQRANAELRARLAEEKALREAEVEGLFDAFLAGSRWIDSPENGRGDVRDMKF
jgi:hypothetical protein